MIALALLCVAGLVAGALHVLSGPDHLAAVSTIMAEQPKQSISIGMVWALGHGAGILLLGALGQLAKGSININRLSDWSEFMVGILLVALGLWNLHRLRQMSQEAAKETPPREPGHVRSSSFGFGLFHGMAGAGHLFGVLPSLVMKPWDAVAYLAAYILGSMIAMVLFAFGARFLVRDPSRRPLALQLTGWGSVLIGLVWIGKTLTA